jgi:hypothetical protein
MSNLHNKLIDNEKIKSEEERDLLCRENRLQDYPSLNYKYVESSENKVDKAFDILFEEMAKIK